MLLQRAAPSPAQPSPALLGPRSPGCLPAPHQGPNSEEQAGTRASEHRQQQNVPNAKKSFRAEQKYSAYAHCSSKKSLYTEDKVSTRTASPRRCAPPRGKAFLPMRKKAEGLRCTMNYCPSYNSLIIKKMPQTRRGVEPEPPRPESRTLARRCSEPLTNTG